MSKANQKARTIYINMQHEKDHVAKTTHALCVRATQNLKIGMEHERARLHAPVPMDGVI